MSGNLRRLIERTVPVGLLCPAVADYLEAVALDVGVATAPEVEELVRLYVAAITWARGLSLVAAEPSLRRALERHIGLLGDISSGEQIRAMCAASREAEEGDTR